MSRSNNPETPTLVASALIAVAMMATAYILPPICHTWSDTGICLPSPSHWGLDRTLSWALNTLLLVAAAPALAMLNKHFNIVREQGTSVSVLTLVLTACNPLVTAGFCTSTLLLIANIICLAVLFGTPARRNATQDYFLIATIVSVGSMTEWAFLAMVPVYLAGGFIMRTLRGKETIAYLLGLVAPYWVAVGLGLVSPPDFRVPRILTIATAEVQPETFAIICAISAALVVSAIFCVNNSVRLYAGNSGVRRMNDVINVMGIVAAVCLFIDFGNVTSYVGTVNLFMAVQAANFLGHTLRSSMRWAVLTVTMLALAFNIWLTISL